MRGATRILSNASAVPLTALRPRDRGQGLVHRRDRSCGSPGGASNRWLAIMCFPCASAAAAARPSPPLPRPTYCAPALRTPATPSRHSVRVAAPSPPSSFSCPLGDFC